jgi:ABC-type transporter Mla MlaB component
MYKRFIKALSVSNTIEIKADKVQKVDTAGLQIVVAVKRKLDKSGGNIMWNKPSKELIDSARILGVSSIIGLND